MNGPAALISAGLGAMFLAAASMFYYQPAFISPDLALDQIFTTNHSKARAAVARLLLDSSSAKFDVMRSVQVEAAKFVCGNVNAKDKTGTYAGNKAFVYTVAIDFARIDDDGQIAQRHDAFKTCPMSAEEQTISDMKLKIPPGAIEMAKKIQKAMPTTDESVLTDLSSQMSAGQLPTGANAQALRQAAGSPGGNHGGPSVTGGAPTGATFKPTLDIENEWRAERPPAAWPLFPADHPLSKPAAPRSPARSLAVANDVEARWIQFRAGATKQRPSAEEMRQALRALLAIDPKDETYPQAWAVFVRLRKIERDAG
jgi:hypothetical protein